MPRPLHEAGKGTYWGVDLTQGEGYKRLRKRKTRAEKKAESDRRLAEQEAETEAG